MNNREANEILDKVQDQIRVVQGSATRIAELLQGNMRMVNISDYGPDILAKIKRELKDYDIRKRKWKVPK